MPPIPTDPSSTAIPNDHAFAGLAFLRRNSEIFLAVFLGIVSVATAYASFQSTLYDSAMSGAYARGQSLITEANSLYIEASQTYAQDLQVWTRLNELAIDMDSPDPGVADAASDKFDAIFANQVSEDLSAAISWADEQNTADETAYTSPLASEDYIATIYSDAQHADEAGQEAILEGNAANALGDRMTLNTVLYAIVLFLLGIASVVRQFRVQVFLASVSAVIFSVALVLTVTIPYLAP